MHTNKILILGNGPSLKKEHFKLFDNIYTLGMNAAYRYWDQINWYPDIYTCLDDQVVLSHAEQIMRLVKEKLCKKFFLHHHILDYYPELKKYPDVYFLPQLRFGEKNKAICDRFNLKHRPSHYFNSLNASKLTTGSYSVRFAAFLGYYEVGLIGTDCRYRELLPEARKVEGVVLEIEQTPARNENYFFDNYQKKGDRYNIPNPSVHQGNLHLQSFEVLKEDITSFGFNIMVNICTKESEVYNKKVFPYKTLNDFITGPSLAAIFVPFTENDLDALIRNLYLWSEDEFKPYFYEPDTPEVELHFAMNASINKQVEERIKSAYYDAGLERYFKAMQFHYSNLSGLRDLYTRLFKGKAGPEGYMSGPNNQFFDIINKFSEGMSHIFLMEVDVVPLRANWLKHLQEIVKNPDPFWICGSIYRGKAAIKATTHINGNALYNVGDSSFKAFFKEIFLPYFYRRIKENPRLPYDIILHDLFMPVYTGKKDQERLSIWKQVIHYFRPSDFIVDLSHEEDRRLDNQLSKEKARATFPRSFLLHGAVGKILQKKDEKEEPLSFAAKAQGGQNSFMQDQKRVLIIDPDGESAVGHYLSYNQKLQKALECLGAKVDVLCNDNMDPRILEKRPHYYPRLSVKSYYVSVDKKSQSRINRAFRELKSFLLQYMQNHQNDLITVYMYVGSLEYLDMLHKIVRDNLRVRLVINLFRLSYVNLNQDYIANWMELIQDCLESKGRFIITVPTRELQEELYNLTGFSIPVAAHPSTTFDDDDFPVIKGDWKEVKRAREKLNVLFPGLPRHEKGYTLTLEAVDYLSAARQEISSSIRHVSWQGTPDNLKTLPEEINKHCHLIEGDLDEENFKAMFREHDVVVLPYDSTSFKNRTSGLLIDAIYAGLPAVVLQGTWLGRIVEEYGCGVVIEDLSPENIYQGLLEIKKNYSDYAVEALKASTAYYNHNNWCILASSILKGWDQYGAPGIKAGKKHQQALLPNPRTNLKKVILIVGNGPSAAELVRYGFHNLPDQLDTFGMVGAYRYFEKIKWWPTYFGLADRKVVYHHRHELARLMEDETVTTKKFYLSWKIADNPRLELIEHSSTGSFCLKKALELGYKEIYLIGMEGKYVEEIAESRPLTDEEFARYGFKELNLTPAESKLRIITKTPSYNPNYFFPDYQREGDIYSLPQSHTHRKNWSDIAVEIQAQGARVYNLSAQSEIKEFDRLDFESFLFKLNCKIGATLKHRVEELSAGK